MLRLFLRECNKQVGYGGLMYIQLYIHQTLVAASNNAIPMRVQYTLLRRTGPPRHVQHICIRIALVNLVVLYYCIY